MLKKKKKKKKSLNPPPDLDLNFSWPISHPHTKCSGDTSSRFCLILLTNKETNRHVTSSSRVLDAAVWEAHVLPCGRTVKMKRWRSGFFLFDLWCYEVKYEYACCSDHISKLDFSCNFHKVRVSNRTTTPELLESMLRSDILLEDDSAFWNLVNPRACVVTL